MKKLGKTKSNILLVLLCLILFSGCTGSFCNSADKASMREYYI